MKVNILSDIMKLRNLLSQADVAQRAGVSIMTVSRVVNGADNVRPETRARVLEAIPFVLVNGRVDDLELSFVDVDNVAGAVIVSLFPLLIFILLSEYFVSGLMAGYSKE